MKNKLFKYDNKIVILEDIFGNKYEGVCSYFDKDYNEHEFGEYEESIVMDNIIFYKSLIKNISTINSFSSSYGALEEAVLEDGLDIIDEVLTSEDDISIYRLLCCIEDNIKTFKKKEKDELIIQIKELIRYNKDKKIIEKSNKILELL